MAWRSLLRSLLLIVAASGEPSCPLEDAPSLSPRGSLLQVRTEPVATKSSSIELGSNVHPAQPSRQPHVCILARTCGPQSACAPGPGDPGKIVQAFLASIVAQVYDSWELHLVNGQGGSEVFTEVVATLSDDRLSNGPSAPNAFANNTWGYEATNYAVEQLFAANVPCEYFLFTNADNLYARGFLETGLPGMLEGRDLLGFNFVSRYGQPSTGWKAHMPMADPGFTIGHIDLGAVLVSAKAMQESSTRFNVANNATTDWKFFETILQRPGGKGSVFYPELHYIHQLLQVNASQLRDAPDSASGSLNFGDRSAQTEVAQSSESRSLAGNLQASAPQADRSTLFYHVHVPRTGGTTVAYLLVADICTPHEKTMTWDYEGDDSLCSKNCDMGLTDNSRSCFPGRLPIEHSSFAVNFERAEGLKTTSGAQKILFVTTLRRGSDRLKSQWALEVATQNWIPPADVPPFSNKSLQLYITGGAHSGKGWGWSVKSNSQRNNQQVAQLASVGFGTDTPVTREHLEVAKQVLMKGDWLIGFTDCLDKVHKKLTHYAEALHGDVSEKVMERALGHEADEDVLDSETTSLLNGQTAFDNELFDWAWGLAAANADPRFAETC